MIVYFYSQVLFLLFLVFYKWFFNCESVLNVLTFFPIFFTTIYLLINRRFVEKKEKVLFFALFIAFIGDVFFMYFDNKVYGIYSFFLIQLINFYYFDDNKTKVSFLSFIAITVLFLCFFLKKISLYLIGLCYFVLFSYNTYTALKYKMTNKKYVVINIGFLCLAVCDFSIFLIMLIQKFNLFYLLDKLLFTIEWMFYVSFQVLVSYAITRVKD